MRISKRQFSRILLVVLQFALLSLFENGRALGANTNFLWNFGNANDGRSPGASLVIDKFGNLYGTTVQGGAYGLPNTEAGGTMFKLTPPATTGGKWSETIIWNFGSGADGFYPNSGLVIDSLGNLYGTTAAGGAYNLGTAFELIPPTSVGGNWTKTILWSFGNGTDASFGTFGAGGSCVLVMDKSGNLYGTSAMGGTYGAPDTVTGGTVFKLTPPSTVGGNWTESVLWNFGFGNDGNVPDDLIADTSGNLYGTTEFGGFYANNGSGGVGTAFKLTRPSTPSGNWKESIVWNFGGYDLDGKIPSGLVMDRLGNLYGTTAFGGLYVVPYDIGGTVFELTPPSIPGENWNESILWNFGDGSDGFGPGSPVIDMDGNIYGPTQNGGYYELGTVFELTPPTTVGGNWNEMLLWNFDGTDGGNPFISVFDTNGNLYGTTGNGGTYTSGAVFEVFGVAQPPPTSTPSATATATVKATATPTEAATQTATATATAGPTATATVKDTATASATATTTGIPTATATPGLGHISVNEKSLNLNAVPDASASGSIIIINTGRGPLTANVSSPKHSPPFMELGGGNGITIGPSGTLEVVIEYTPTKKGSTRDQILITSNDPAQKKTIKVKIKGKSK